MRNYGTTFDQKCITMSQKEELRNVKLLCVKGMVVDMQR